MNAITQLLLAGAALGALATAPAIAENTPHFEVTALHGRSAVHKTKMACGLHCLYTSVQVSTYVPASDLNRKTELINTYYKWSSNSSICTNPREKLKGWKKSTYGKISHNTETYSVGCAVGPTVFYGDTYKLINPDGEGRTDYFYSKLIGKFERKGMKYKGILLVNVNVRIGS